ncbi:MAG: pilus assembly protein [Asticcacaulis sp.]
MKGRFVELRTLAGRASVLKDRSGAIAVEFALISPILILMLTGIFNYGSYFWTSHALQQMANDAARVAIAGMTQADRADRAQALFLRQSEYYDLTIPGASELTVEENGQTLTVRIHFVPEADEGFNMMGSLPGMPATIERSASVVRGGY